MLSHIFFILDLLSTLFGLCSMLSDIFFHLIFDHYIDTDCSELCYLTLSSIYSLIIISPLFGLSSALSDIFSNYSLIIISPRFSPSSALPVIFFIIISPISLPELCIV